MITPDEAKALVLELFGPPSDEEAATLWGRTSSSRAVAHAQGGGRCLPDLPPVELDVSLRYDEECAVHQIRTRAARQHCRYRGVTKRARLASANVTPRERTRRA